MVVHTLGFKSMLPHGGFAVDFFFILSGFVLGHALIRRSVSPVAFAWARLARLYPLHLLTLIWLLYLAGGVTPSGISAANSSSAFFLNLALLQGLGTLGIDTWNFPSWSISVEFLVNLFVLYPVVRTRSIAIAALLIILSLIAICNLWGPIFDLLNIQLVESAVLSGGLLRGTAGILLGYLLYEAYLRLHPRIAGNRFVIAATLCEILVIALLVLSTASFHYIERPAQRALMRLFRGWSKLRPPHEAQIRPPLR